MMRNRPKTSLAIRARRLLARMKNVRGLSDDEKALHALGLAATPEERWQLVQNHLRLFNSSPPSKDKLHILLIRQVMRARRASQRKANKWSSGR